MALDADPEVVGVAAQPMWLRWTGESGRLVRHAPDYFARRADGTAVVIDVRPDQRIGEKDAAVFAATGRLCAEVGWEYQRAGELGAVHAANLRWLAGYRHPRFAQPELAARLGEVFADEAPLLGGAAAAGDPVAVLPVLFGMLWRGELAADLERGLLGPAMLVHARGGCAGRRQDPAVKAGRVSGRGLPVLAPGDEIRLGGQAYRVVALDGTSVRLADVAGAAMVMLTGHLLADPGFELLTSHRRVPLAAGGLGAAAVEVRASALWWEQHLVEVLTGVPAGAVPGTAPRPEFDPRLRSLRQRELAKHAALTGEPGTRSR